MGLISMPISQNITNRIEMAATSEAEKELMMRILQIEDKGVFRFEAEYEKAIKTFLSETAEKGDVE